MPRGKKLDMALYGRLIRETVERMILEDGHTEGITSARVAAAVGLTPLSIDRVLGRSFAAYFRAEYPAIEDPRQVARRELFLEVGRRLARERGLETVTAYYINRAEPSIPATWVQRHFPEPKAPVMAAALEAGELRTVGEAIALRIQDTLALPMETQMEAVAALVIGGPEAWASATSRAT